MVDPEPPPPTVGRRTKTRRHSPWRGMDCVSAPLESKGVRPSTHLQCWAASRLSSRWCLHRIQDQRLAKGRRSRAFHPASRPFRSLRSAERPYRPVACPCAVQLITINSPRVATRRTHPISISSPLVIVLSYPDGPTCSSPFLSS